VENLHLPATNDYPDKSVSAKTNKVVSILKEKLDFENSHLRLNSVKGEGILSKCFNYGISEQAKKLGVYPFFKEIEQTDEARVIIDGKQVITVSNNNYLGLAKHPKVIAAGKKALEDFGAGCTGSRFLNGTLSLHKTLERNISSFLDREDTIVMSTGFQANQGTIACLLGRKDIAFSDRENHASIYEGCAIAPGKTVRYRHSDMDHLEYCLKKYSDVEGKLIITDSVFSMSGDIANLAKIVQLAKDHNASVLVDEAHGLGVMGDMGRGLTHHCGLEKEIDLYVGTFSKSLGSIGGFVSGNAKVMEFIRHKASAFIFTAALPPASVAAVTAGLEVMQNDPECHNRLRDNTSYVKKEFFEMGFQVNNNLVPIVPILIGDEALTLFLNKLLFDDGVFASVAVSPVVPPHNAMIRTSYTAAHSREDLDLVLASFKKLGTKLGIISK
jgi:8-amino-7-oxononanoate synthase